MSETNKLTAHLIVKQFDELELEILKAIFESEIALSPKYIYKNHGDSEHHKVSRRLRKMESDGYVKGSGKTQDRKYTLTEMGKTIVEFVWPDFRRQ